MTETATGTLPANGEKLVDKKGRPLRGAALKVAQLKKRDGKGPRPPARGQKKAAISPTPATSSTTTIPATKSGGGLLDRLSRVW